MRGGNNLIYSCHLTSLRPIMWHGQEVYAKYEQIVSVVSSRISPDAAAIFAKPVVSDDAIRGNGKSLWFSDHAKNPIPITNISENDRDHYWKILSNYIDKITDLARSLQSQANDEEREAGEILEIALEVPSPDCVLVEGGAITLVCWGFLPTGGDSERFRLIKKLSKPASPAAGEAPPPPLPPPPPSRRRPWLMAGAATLAFLAVAAAGTFWYLGLGAASLPGTPGFAPHDPAQVGVLQDDPLKRQVVLNRLLLMLRDGEDIEAFMRRINDWTRGVKVVGYRPELGIVQIEFSPGRLDEMRTLFRNRPEVQDVAVDALESGGWVPNDPAFEDASAGMTRSWGLQAIKAPDAWSMTHGAGSVRIAIIDHGFAPGHPEFSSKQPVTISNIPGRPQLGPANGWGGHGTHVSGIAAAVADNRAGAAGACPDCSLIMVDVVAGDKTSTATIIDGMSRAIQAGARVLNLSLGMEVGTEWKEKTAEELRALLPQVIAATEGNARIWERAYTMAARAQAVVVRAAGNDNIPATFDPGNRSGIPLYVGAAGPDRKRAGFSNFGETVTVSAPGVEIFNAYPPDRYERKSGTSMAAPFVTGTVGLLLSVNPGLTVGDIRRILVETAEPLADSDRSRMIGPLINAAKAVEKAKAATPSPPRDGQDAACTCTDLQRRVTDLERRLAELERSAGQRPPAQSELLTLPQDPPADFQFAEGRWRASRNLVRRQDNVAIEILFDIKRNGTGKITYVEPEQGCSATLTLNFADRNLTLTQTAEAQCSDRSQYSRYRFVCVADSNSKARCKAGPLDEPEATLVDFHMEREG